MLLSRSVFEFLVFCFHIEDKIFIVNLLQTTRNAVLSRYAEHKEMRVKTFQNSTAVYDLLTLTLVRRAQFDMLSEVG